MQRIQIVNINALGKHSIENIFYHVAQSGRKKEGKARRLEIVAAEPSHVIPLVWKLQTAGLFFCFSFHDVSNHLVLFKEKANQLFFKQYPSMYFQWHMNLLIFVVFLIQTKAEAINVIPDQFYLTSKLLKNC